MYILTLHDRVFSRQAIIIFERPHPMLDTQVMEEKKETLIWQQQKQGEGLSMLSTWLNIF
jgi:hypothetical protein